MAASTTRPTLVPASSTYYNAASGDYYGSQEAATTARWIPQIFAKKVL